MPLALSAVRHAGEPLANAVTTPLTATHCKIGRGRDCDIELEDPSRRVSRLHATVVRQGDSYVLTVNSAVNPVVVNENTLTVGQSVVLSVGDEIAIGDYVFNVVNAESAAQAGGGNAEDLFGVGRGSSGAGRSELDDLLDTSGSRPDIGQPSRAAIDNLIGGHRPRGADPLLDILGGGPDGNAMPTDSPTTGDDPLMQLLGEDSGAHGGSGTGGIAPAFSNHTPGAVTSIDHLLGSGASSAADPLGVGVPDHRAARPGFGGGRDGSQELDHVHDINLPFTPPRARHVPVSAPRPSPASPSSGEDDPLAALLGEPKGVPRRSAGAGDPLGLFGELQSDQPPNVPSDADVNLQDPTYVVRAEAPSAPVRRGGAPGGELPDWPAPDYSADVARPETPALAANREEHPGASAGLSMGQALQAFLEGACMQGVKVSDAEAEDFLRECGAVCRVAVEGVMGLLLARATVKDQLRVSDRTMIAARENNPLKVMESNEEALRFVFDRSSRAAGFLPPDKAVGDACADLQAHEIALVAGMRSALMGAIKRFNPPVIEKRLENEGGSSLLANKKAKLWDTFLAYYEKTANDAEDNFDRVFGADFLRAYQEQLKRLKG